MTSTTTNQQTAAQPIDLDSLPLYFNREYYRVEDVRAALARQQPVARVDRIISASGLAEVSVFLESALKVGTVFYAAPVHAAAAPSAPAAPHAQAEPVIDILLDVARLAYDAMDNTEDDGNALHWNRSDFDALSKAMDKLEELPDDQPGYVMGPAAKAAWAMRQAAPVPQEAEQSDVELIRIPAHDADSYCRILSILGMEEQGDPVAEVQRLFDANTTQEAEQAITTASESGHAQHVECRECAQCGHIGINDSSDTTSACHNCDWNGPTPSEDHCPGCSQTNCMGAACPMCGGIYKLLAETEIGRASAPGQDAPASQEAEQAATAAVTDERRAQRERISRKLLAMPEGQDVIGPVACMIPPKGWYCTRVPGHEGPCAAHPAAQPAAPAVTDAARDVLASAAGAGSEQAKPSKIVITLRQAHRLVEFFGGHDTSVTVMPPAPDWEQQVPGLYAYCTEYPEDGSEYLGPTEVDDDLARLGERGVRAALAHPIGQQAGASDFSQSAPSSAPAADRAQSGKAAVANAGSRELSYAILHLEALTQFAYQHGFHELGYSPVDTVRAALWPADRAPATSAAAVDVLAERRRQVEVEGWTPEHDDKYGNCELARAAATYALCSHVEQLKLCGAQVWPWRPDWWKRGSYRCDLVKAGALILAEIDRVDRDRTAAKGAA